MSEQCGAPVQDEEQPTSAAHVTFRTTPDGPSIALGVPADQSGLLVTSVVVATGVGGSIFGPYLMARALHMMEANMPWQLQAALIVLASLLPLAYFLLGRRRS
ncbi:hypothetical protein [Streptomyces sp. WAC06273]|uniref:hypothetical protein n=1 Tax=Streptomyces sp. WAC06273 TaxID=2487422 RepID=UPI000F73848D|nr:hypothetical protein [Streptomyces sp. WAC06273]RSS64198.1 hypothetical protein EF907_23195 [Streptomyces sp. WAC06273]